MEVVRDDLGSDPDEALEPRDGLLERLDRLQAVEVPDVRAGIQGVAGGEAEACSSGAPPQASTGFAKVAAPARLRGT